MNAKVDHFAGAVRQQPDLAQPKGSEDVGANAIIPKAHGWRRFARLGGQAPHQRVTGVWRLHVQYHASPGFGHGGKR